MEGCADDVVCRIIDPPIGNLLNYINPSNGINYFSIGHPGAGFLNSNGRTSNPGTGAIDCSQTSGNCPTECPGSEMDDENEMPDEGDEGGDAVGLQPFSSLPSSIVAPGCGTIRLVECPLIRSVLLPI